MAKTAIPFSDKGTNNSDMRYYGLYRARCINNVDPFGRGRILVHIYLRDGALNYDESSHQWIPVLTPYGGIRGMGMSITPPIHADGFVIFEEGRTSSPVWIGAYPFAPFREVDEEASQKAGYTVINTRPTIPAEQAQDPTRIVIKTQYPSLENPSPESNDNAVENTIVMDENKLELFHVNKNAYEYQIGGTGGLPGSFIRLQDTAIDLGVRNADGRVFSISISSEGITLSSSLGDQISITDNRIKIKTTDQGQVSIESIENGAISMNTRNFTVDGEQIIVGPPGALGGGGIVNTQSICPFVGLPIHQGSSKAIVGG